MAGTVSKTLNEFERFEQRYGDYTFYETSREEILEELYTAFKQEQSVEKLVMVEHPSRIDDDLFEHFLEEEQDIVSSVLGPFSSLLDGKVEEEVYSDFADGFEIESAGEDMLYWCRYEP